MNVSCMLLYKATFFVEPSVSPTSFLYVHSASFHYVSSASFQYDLTVSFRMSHLAVFSMSHLLCFSMSLMPNFSMSYLWVFSMSRLLVFIVSHLTYQYALNTSKLSVNSICQFSVCINYLAVFSMPHLPGIICQHSHLPDFSISRLTVFPICRFLYTACHLCQFSVALICQILVCPHLLVYSETCLVDYIRCLRFCTHTIL